MNKKSAISSMLVTSIVIGNVSLMGYKIYGEENNNKEEVIYVVADASGNVKSVDAVNIFNKGSHEDYGDYTQIKNLNTTDTLTQDQDKITFTTESDKIYYQGTLSNQTIPWNIKVEYTLDGQSIEPEDLAGKSGQLEIHIKIDKNEQSNTDFYDNYALQATLTLDTEKCENIEAEGATLANVGKNKQISYTILPGKGLDATIKTKVNDFTMDAMSINGIKLNLNIDIDDDELKEKVQEIMDATKSLNDGATTLSDGTSTLLDGTNTVNKGASSLDEGVNSLNKGLNDLNSGVGSMQKALLTLNNNSSSLTQGSHEVLLALTTIQEQLNQVSFQKDQLNQLVESSTAIKQGIQDAYQGALALQSSLSFDAYKQTMNANGLNIDTLQAGNTQAINELSTQIQDLSGKIAQIKAIPSYEINPELVQQVTTLEAQVNSLTNIVTLLTGNNAAIMGTDQYLTATSNGLSELVAGLEKLSTSYEQFDQAILALTTSLSDLMVNLSQLQVGINQLVSHYSTLDNGLNDYTNGVASIVAAYNQLVSGSQTLTSGSKQLLTGSTSLKEGTNALYQGAQSLDSGMKELNSGTNEFYEQTSTMDMQMEDTINDMLESLSGSDDVKSYVSDKNTDVDAVQFVIKTDAIEKDEENTSTVQVEEKLSFFDKLLKLFHLK